jgi:hypothetical protein
LIWGGSAAKTRSHATGLILAHNKFQVILAAEQTHAGVILHVLFLYVGRCAHGEFHGVADDAPYQSANQECEPDRINPNDITSL